MRHVEDDDFAQAGRLYRSMRSDERERQLQNIAASLSQVDHEEFRDRSIGHFRNADPEYGARLEQAVKARRSR